MKPATLAALASACLIPLAACTANMDEERDIRAPAINVVGEPVNCITVSQIRGTTAHDDYTIDFQMNGGRTYRNTLPGRCYSLGFEDRFTYEVHTGQLCSVDTITVLHSDGTPGQTCGLGEFLPVEIAR
jgi:hypothetical protein